MYDNWSEIIEIMKPVLSFNRNRTEIKMALGSCLRTLGWRTSTGSMRSDYRVDNGETIDIVLGNTNEDGGFHIALPILICSEDSANDIHNKTTKVMTETNAKIAIVVGNSFDLFILNTDTNKAIQIGQIYFDLDNEEGIRFFTLLLASDFNESNLIAYFESLFKSKIPSIKLDAKIKEVIVDKTKAEEILRLYLEFEGFEGEIVDKALLNVGINIFYKSNKTSESTQELPEKPNLNTGKTGNDNTLFSFNDGPFLTKRRFVHGLIAQYIKDNPTVTLDELETRFPSQITSKVRGVIRTLAQVKAWAEQNGPDILTRYCTKESEILSLYDGTEIVVNSQWGAKNFPRFLALAKKIYNVKSDAPYEGIEYSESLNKTNTNATRSTRSRNFKFSMAGIRIGETIVFDPTNTKVKVVSEDSIEYKGKTYRLTPFVQTYLPDYMRHPTDTYRGPNYFSYKGETLTNLRNRNAKEESSPSEEKMDDGMNKGIQISMRSFNSFKKKK